MRRFLAFAGFFAVTSAAALAAAVAPSAIVADPSSFDGKTISVAGSVKGFETSSTPMGTVAGYQLCDAQCIVVIDESNQAQTDGSTATVTGTFHATFKTPRKSFTNALVIGK